MKVVKNRLKWLWKDDRSFKWRFLTALIVNISFAFFFLFFTPSEMFIGNMSDFGFTYGVTAAVMGVASLIYVVLATAGMMLLRGKIFDAVVTFVFSFTLTSYIQGNFMNSDFGYMNGQAIEWQEYAKLAMLNIAVWSVIMLIPFIVRLFSRNVWSKALQFVSAFLVVIQAVALVSLLLTADFTLEQGKHFVSSGGLYEVGEKDNVIVFVLDYTDNEYADELERDEPGFFDRLEGFTRYTDYASVYRATLPSVPFLLTATPWDPMESLWVYPQYAFNQSSFLKEMKDLNSSVNVYTLTMYMGEAGFDYIDNYVEEKPQVDYFGLFRAMENCTLYRTMPIIAKSTFWFYTNDLTNMAIDQDYVSLETTPYDYDNSVFYDGLKEYGLSVRENDDTDKNFTFIHLFGSHYPWTIDEYGNRTDNGTLKSQGFGCFRIVYEYLDKLKELGLYDESTIIIMSDHGMCIFDEDAVEEKYNDGEVWFTDVYEDFAPTPILFVKPAGKGEGDPYTESKAPVTQYDFHATILEALGGDGSKYGRTIFDIAEDEERTRYYYFRHTRTGTTYERSFEYEINGEARDLSNWSTTGKYWNRSE